jgi:hypothetical protein
VAHFAGEPLPGCPPGYADGDRELVPRAAAFARGLHGILLAGRGADRVTMAALGWRGGDRLTLTADAGVMVARLAPFARCGQLSARLWAASQRCAILEPLVRHGRVTMGVLSAAVF